MSISGSPGGAGGAAGVRRGNRRALVRGVARLDLDRDLAPRLRSASEAARLRAASLVASENAVVLAKEPCPPRPTAGKDAGR